MPPAKLKLIEWGSEAWILNKSSPIAKFAALIKIRTLMDFVQMSMKSTTEIVYSRHVNVNNNFNGG